MIEPILYTLDTVSVLCSLLLVVLSLVLLVSKLYGTGYRSHYKDVLAPTMTLAVGLKPCVVLHPVADRATVTNNVAALILAIFLPYFL